MKQTDQKHRQGWLVGPESIRMIQLGHPWIIADSFTRRWPAGSQGQLIELVDDQGRFQATALLDPEERIVARILSRRQIRLDSDWILKKLQTALELRKQHAALVDTNAWRLLNAEGDGLPGLTIDIYDRFVMLQLYSNAWRPHLPLLLSAIKQLIEPTGIYEKTRPQNTRELEASSESKRYGRLIAGKAAPDPLIVKENGLTLQVSLETGLNTGLFLDQRKNRLDLMARASGKRLLNLFSYTGAFSVAAAAAGAAQVTSVDVSQGYTDWAMKNFELNRINTKKHQFIVGDCLKVLRQMGEKQQQFDIILMDPPSFSTTGKGRFTTRGGTSELVEAALKLLPENGLLITSSNHQKVDLADYQKELRKGALQAGCGLRVITTHSQPEDFPYPVTFPEGRYLKYVIGIKTRE
jgi:23S rRNA (cytosine1962-C5)-methyltransferase